MVKRLIGFLVGLAVSAWGAYALVTAVWSWLAPSSRVSTPWSSTPAWGVDPENPDLRLRIGLTPAELAEARERERKTVLLG